MSEVDSKMAGNSLAARAFYRFVRTFCVVSCRTYLRMSVEGLEHVPASGPFVIAPVHRSYIDTPIVAVVSSRRQRYMGKDSLWKNSVSGWLLSALGGFPVTRGTADREALKRCIEVLKGGEPLVLFPEGERKSGPTIQPLFDGAAYVAARGGAPILPIGIGGSERVMPKGAKFLRPTKIAVVIGPLIAVDIDPSGRVPRAALKDVSDRLTGELQRLFDLAQQRVGIDQPPSSAQSSSVTGT